MAAEVESFTIRWSFYFLQKHNQMSTEAFRKKLCSHLCCERNRLVLSAAQVEKEIGVGQLFAPTV